MWLVDLEDLWRAAFEFTEGRYSFGKEATLTVLYYRSESGKNGYITNEAGN